MSNTEHRVSVCNGKYTFIVTADDYRISILRHGEQWHGPQADASNALHSIMCELDAARVVLVAARALGDAFSKCSIATLTELSKADEAVGLVRALALHDRLCSDQEKPSSWCGGSETT